MEIILTILIALITAYIGYFIGTLKYFSEQKQTAYNELIPPIIAMAYSRDDADEINFNKALVKLWLYGSKKVTIKMDDAVSKIIKPDRGDVTGALQKAIIEIRNDIQPWWQRWGKWKLLPEDVKHIYARIVERSNVDTTSN